LLLINCNNRFQFALEKLSSAIKLPSLFICKLSTGILFLIICLQPIGG